MSVLTGCVKLWRREYMQLMIPILAAIACVTACGDEHPLHDTASPINAQTAIEQRLHALVNAHRDSLGLAPLLWSELIAHQCRLHSYNMATGAVPFGHEGFSERGAIIADSIPHSGSAENVLYNRDRSDPALAALRSWLGSTGHRANIQGTYNMTGVGVVASDGGTYYFTQFFIRAR